MSTSGAPDRAVSTATASMDRLLETISRLRSDGELSAEEAERLSRQVSHAAEESRYILRHLAAHLSVGVVFSFDLLPLPMGTLSRGTWVIANRIYECWCGRWDRAGVHSLAVLGVALIPFVGYFAYLLPLRSRSAETAFVYANQISYARHGRSLETYLQTKPKWFARLVRWIAPPVRQPIKSA